MCCSIQKTKCLGLWPGPLAPEMMSWCCYKQFFRNKMLGKGGPMAVPRRPPAASRWWCRGAFSPMPYGKRSSQTQRLAENKMLGKGDPNKRRWRCGGAPPPPAVGGASGPQPLLLAPPRPAPPPPLLLLRAPVLSLHTLSTRAYSQLPLLTTPSRPSSSSPCCPPACCCHCRRCC